jgi:DNA adenine methylase
LIRANDAPGVVIYCDPPYLHETRTVTDGYTHEMSRADHERLLECLLGCKGRVFLSGYPSELYTEALRGWRLSTFDMPNHSGQRAEKERRTECVWSSPVRQVRG